MIKPAEDQQLSGRPLRTRDGDKIAVIAQVYADDYHGDPEWVSVAFGGTETFVPLSEADLVDGELVVPYSRRLIRDAPVVAAGQQFGEADEQALYDHYGIACSTDYLS